MDVRRSPTENLEAVAKALGKSVRDVTVVILDRPRHAELIEEVRASGARIKLISDGDVAGAISVAWPDSGVDVLYGTGAPPKGSSPPPPSSAWAARSRGACGHATTDERTAAIAAGYDLDAVLTTDDLVKGDNCFFAATAVTDGELLQGVRYHDYGATTQSMVMRSRSGTVRFVSARHALTSCASSARSSSADGRAGTALSTRRRSAYPLRNAEPAEARPARDPAVAARRVDHPAISSAWAWRPGWRCAELGAGAGSVARWLLERGGRRGSVTAIDSDTALLADLADAPQRHVVKGIS